MDGSDLYREVDSFLLKGDFLNAQKLVKNQDQFTLWDIVSMINANKSTLYCYSFLINLLSEKENAEEHYLASVYLTHIINFYPGAYSTALYHLRKAIELDPINTKYKEGILFYHKLPEHLVSKEEAIKLAQEILMEKPESFPAKEVLSIYGIKEIER